MAGYIGSKANVSQIDGYVKSEVDTLLGQELNLSGGSMTGHLNFGDNIKIQSGAGTDLQIYHDASNSYIKDAGTGSLRLSATTIELMKVDTSELMASFAQDGAVTLYYDNAAKLATASGGITITGNASFADNGKAILGGGSDLQIYHDGLNSYIEDTGTGSLIIEGTNLVLRADDGSRYLQGVDGASGVTRLYHPVDDAIKLSTTATGIDVTGTVTADGLTVDAANSTFNGAVGITSAAGAGISEGLLIDYSTNLARFLTYDSTTGSEIAMYTQPSGGSTAQRLRINSGGDISFYEDTGTTPKFFWDASAESLGIGTSAPSASYSIDTAKGIRSSGAAPNFTLQETDASNQTWLMGSYGGSFAIRDTTVAGTSYPFKIEAAAPSNTLYLDTSGRVGIGTTSANAILTTDPESGNFSSTYNNYDGVGLFIRGNGTSGNGNYGPALVFGSCDSDTANQDHKHSAISVVQTDTDPNQTGLAFWTHPSVTSTDALVEAMRITSAGNLLVGKTALNFAEAGTEIMDHGEVQVTRAGGVPMYIRRNTSDGDLIGFYKDGTAVGSIGSSASQMYIGYSDTGIRFTATADDIRPWNPSTGVIRDGAIDLGDSAGRFKDLYLSGGVVFGATGGSVTGKTLDDYEEGTFTPTFVGSTGGTVTLAAAFDKYAYTKVGRVVTITGRVDVSGTPSLSGNLLLQGLPFSSGDLSDSAGYTVQYGFITIGSSNTGNPIVVELQENVTQATLRLEDWSSASGVLTNNSRIQMSITYFTN